MNGKGKSRTTAMPTAALFMLVLPWATPCARVRGAGPACPDGNSRPGAAASQPAGTQSTTDSGGRALPPRTGDDELRPVGGSNANHANGIGWLRTLGALAIVAGLIFAARWLLRRWRPSGLIGAAGPVEVLARAPVAPKQQIVLVRLGGRLVLVGTGAGAMSTLAEVTDPAEVRELIDGVRAVGARGLAGLLARHREGEGKQG